MEFRNSMILEISREIMISRISLILVKWWNLGFQHFQHFGKLRAFWLNSVGQGIDKAKGQVILEVV